jgi:hypothetical protein
MSDMILKYPTWQGPYRSALIETNPELLKDRIAAAEQIAKLRLEELENSEDSREERIALTDALTTLKILGELGSL